VQDAGELLYSLGLRLAGAVCKENVRDLDAQLVVAIEDLKHTLALGDKAVTMDEDTVDIEHESHILCCTNLLTTQVLDLCSQNVPAGLDRGHTRTGRFSTLSIANA